MTKKYRNVEEASHRIRNRFKFLPDFEAFPTTLDTAIPNMLHEKWGVTNAAVITSSVLPPSYCLRQFMLGRALRLFI
jgi:hypothetical protein